MAVDIIARGLAGRADSKAITAYEYAKRAGYTGTEEEFAEDMGNSATNAENARESAEQAQEYAEQAEQAMANKVGVITISDPTTTMLTIENMLAEINANGDHVVFDVSALGTGMYLCTMYISSGFYRISDMVTGFVKEGFFKHSDLLVDILNSTPSITGKHYTMQWDKVNAKGTRLNDAVSITDDTSNFGHFGSVNENYNNPFDSIYPWSGRKLCNIDLETYRGLTAGNDITDCVVAWEDDANFDYNHQYGVWVYTPEFFGRTYELGNYRYFDVTDEFTQNNILYPAMITARWLGVDIELSIDGTSKHCNISKQGMPMANVTMANQHLEATNWGASLDDIYSLDASTLLFVVEYATLNSQTAVGGGCDSLYKQGMHPDADVTNGTVISVTASGLNTSIVREGAIVDIGTSDGGNNIARTSIASATITGGTATIILADAVTVTTAHFISLHGIINIADEEIGSHSGYIGTNGYVNAYYRGEALWGNKFYYVLGAYRQTGTQHIWIADRDDTDNYDALNTSKHIDTGLVLPNDTNEAKSGYVNKLGIAEGLNIPPFATEMGGNSANPVGDYVYVPATSNGNTVLLLGGYASNGPTAGLFYGAWHSSSAISVWSLGSRPRLKNP